MPGVSGPDPRAAEGASLLGKTPNHADFLRLGVPTQAAMQLHRWLEQANTESPLCSGFFMFALPDTDESIVGAIVPSRDRVGRSFPLTVFTSVRFVRASGAFAWLPAASEPFLRSAANLLLETTSSDILNQRLPALPVPVHADFNRAATLRAEGLKAAQATALQDAFATQGLSDRHLYALHTFLLACEGEKRAPGHSGVVLDCPLFPPMRWAFWLELLMRRVPTASPSLAWTDHRLLISFDPSSPSLLSFLANPEHRSSKLWPLLTQRQAAIDIARDELPAQAREVLNRPDVSFDVVLQTLARC
ncbi:MAG: type VI secretion system-associated protein TagF [Myxococcaceae bacterium]